MTMWALTFTNGHYAYVEDEDEPDTGPSHDEDEASSSSVERWAFVPGYDQAYEVSSFGRVRSWLGRGRRSRPLVPKLMKPAPDKEGRPTVNLRKPDGTYSGRQVCRLVLLAFRGPPPEAPEGCPPGQVWFACHVDDVNDHNTLVNLYWGTRVENARDASRNGCFRPKTVITHAQVRTAKALRARNVSWKAVSAELGLAVSTIRSALARNRVVPVAPVASAGAVVGLRWWEDEDRLPHTSVAPLGAQGAWT